MPIGEVLRNARLEKGYSFEYLEEATKIRAKYLEALENENFDVLPGQVYAKAFLRTYAKFLELNAEEIINEFSQSTKDTSPVVEMKVHEDEPVVGSKRWKYLVAGLAVVSLLAFNAVYNANKKPVDNRAEVPNVIQKQPAQNANVKNNATKEKEQTKAEGVRIVLKVTDTQSWMQVEADGNTVFSGLVAPGEMKDFAAQEKIFLHVGNAGAVEVNVNGKDLGRLGENGKVVKIPFTAGEDPTLTQG